MVKKKSFFCTTMRTLNWCWTRLYWDTLYFTLVYIPILPISRYDVNDLWWWQYQFHDKYKLQTTKDMVLDCNCLIFFLVIYIIFRKCLKELQQKMWRLLTKKPISVLYL